MADTFEWIKLSASLLTPLAVLVLGLAINRRLEDAKARMSKEREWESYWASAFLRVANDYNGCATRIVTSMAQLARRVEEDDIDGANRIIADINAITSMLSGLEWELQQYSDFARANGATVRAQGKRLFDAVQSLVEEKSGDLEAIRRLQFEFTDAVRLVHSEILSIAPDRALRPFDAPQRGRSGSDAE